MLKFTMPEPHIALCGVLGRGDDQDELNKRFGSMWKKVPNKPNVYYVKDDVRKVQLTLLLVKGKPFEFAIYTEESFAVFKEQFDRNETPDCTYHRIDPNYKHIGLQVIIELKKQNLW